MRLPWPRRWRRGSKSVTPEISGYRPGSWAEVALPPGTVSAAASPAEPRVPAVTSPVAALVAAEPAAVLTPRSGVRLGFADGTHVDMDDQESRALKDVAVRLLGES
jgi:hypothetical protein